MAYEDEPKIIFQHLKAQQQIKVISIRRWQRWLRHSRLISQRAARGVAIN